MRLTVIELCVCGLFLLQSPVFADSADDWNPPSAGPVTTWTAPVQGKGQLAIQLYAIYNITRGNFNDEGHYVPLSDGDKQSQFQQQILAKCGITDKWEFDGQMVYQENYITDEGVKAHESGLGDSYLFTRYQFLDDKGWVPTTTGILQLKMPTGKYQHEDPDKDGADLMGASTGGGSWDPGVGINFSKKLKPFMVHADLIESFPQEVHIDGDETKFAEYLHYDAAVEYFLTKGFSLMMELNGLAQGDKRVNGGMVPDSDTKSLIFAPGIGWSNDKIQTLIAYQRVIWGTNAAANDSIVATFVYTF